MPSASPRASAVTALDAALLVALGVGAAFALHWRALGYGFVYDDYAFLRPITAGELWSTFHGTWDPSGIQAAFYRPLTVLLHKVRFDWLQFDARACHVLSLLLVGVAGGLLGAWVARVSSARWVGAVGAVLAVAHPAGVWSMTAWITNQMHALQAVVIAVALNWWWRVRDRGAAAWIPLYALQAVAFGIKEDGIMLLPTLLALHAIRPGASGRSRVAPAAVLLATATLLGGLMWLRALALKGLGGYGGALAVDRVAVTLAAGPRAILSSPVGIGPLSWLIAAAVLVGCLRRRTEAARAAAFLIGAGAVMVALWNLPFAYVSKPEQYYALAIGASIALTGTIAGLVHLLPATTWARAAAAALVGGWLVAAATDDRLLARQFSPTHGYVRQTDEIALGWPLPPELLDYLRARRDALRDGRQPPPLDEVLQTASYGFYSPEQDRSGDTFQWTPGLATVFVRRTSRALRFEALAGHVPAGAPGQRLRVEVDGETVADLTLRADAWREVVVPIGRSSLRAFARVDLVVADTWRPSEVIAGSDDRRILGVRVRSWQLR